MNRKQRRAQKANARKLPSTLMGLPVFVDGQRATGEDFKPKPLDIPVRGFETEDGGKVVFWGVAAE